MYYQTFLGPKNPIQVRDGLDMIPMWIADMNFPALPTITEAIIERAKHPTYGYFKTRDEYFDSIIRWHETRNHVTGLEKEHIGYENGVLGGVASALHVLCSQGDNVPCSCTDIHWFYGNAQQQRISYCAQ